VTPPSGGVPVVQLLVLQDATSARELSLALWAALREVERFYQTAARPISALRYYGGAPVPSKIRDETGKKGRLIPAERVAASFGALRRERTQPTYPAGEIGQLARELTATATEIITVITDIELTPPSNWRYIVWDSFRGGAAISVAPTDPTYWREREPSRVARIKHRVRTACLCATGALLGHRRCDNRRCFLYENVESVLDLDAMVYLGVEHDELPDRKGKGYAVRPKDPSRVQPLQSAPESEIEMVGSSRWDVSS
jgi:hypothetical protein